MGCKIWTIKKAENQRIDAFLLWCWRRLLRVPWTARRSNQSILKEINSEYSLEGLMLKLQYSGYLLQKADSLEKTLMLGKFEGRRRRGWQRMRWLDGITDSMHKLGQTLGDDDGQGSLVCWSPWGRKELDMTWRLNSKYNKSYSISYSWTTTMHMNLVWQSISMIWKRQAIQLSSYFLKLWSWLKGGWSMWFLLTPCRLVFSFHQQLLSQF